MNSLREKTQPGEYLGWNFVEWRWRHSTLFPLSHIFPRRTQPIWLFKTILTREHVEEIENWKEWVYLGHNISLQTLHCLNLVIVLPRWKTQTKHLLILSILYSHRANGRTLISNPGNVYSKRCFAKIETTDTTISLERMCGWFLDTRNIICWSLFGDNEPRRKLHIIRTIPEAIFVTPDISKTRQKGRRPTTRSDH